MLGLVRRLFWERILSVSRRISRLLLGASVLRVRCHSGSSHQVFGKCLLQGYYCIRVYRLLRKCVLCWHSLIIFDRWLFKMSILCMHNRVRRRLFWESVLLSLIHISEPTRLGMISYAV